MNISKITLSESERVKELEQRIENQQLLIARLTQKINHLTSAKDGNSLIMDQYTAELSRLKDKLITGRDQSRIYNLIINKLNAVFVLVHFHSRNDFEFIWTNDHYVSLAQDMIDYENGWELTGQIKNCISSEDRSVIEESYDFFRKNPDKTFHKFYRRENKNSEYNWLVIQSVVSKLSSDGHPEEVFGLAVDVTGSMNVNDTNRRAEENEILLQYKGKTNVLTRREKEIVGWIIRGYTNKEIASNLNISTHTVDTHRKSIMKKLQLKNTASLVSYAAANGLR